MRMGDGDSAQVGMFYMGDAAARHGEDPMIHYRQREGLQIDKVAGNLQRSDLARSVCEEFVPGSKAFEQEGTDVWSGSFGDGIFTGRHGALPPDDGS